MSEFSKKTGDFGSLSAVDLRVLGLALGMEREAHGGDISHLRTEPTVRPTVKQHEAAVDAGGNSNNLPGFYNPGSEDEEESANEEVGYRRIYWVLIMMETYYILAIVLC